MMMVSPAAYAEDLAEKTDRELLQEKGWLLNILSCKPDKESPNADAFVQKLNYKYLTCVLQEMQKRNLEGMMLSDKMVEICADSYIPFEPQYASKEIQLRAVIRAAIGKLKPENNQVLFAEFGDFSGKKMSYDIENILFYNIGGSFFSNACGNGVVFSQMQETGSHRADYLYRYSMVDPAALPIPQKAAITWINIPIEGFCASLKPANYWQAMKNNWEHIELYQKEKIDGNFGLSLQIEIPKGRKTNIAAAMKPMLDGIICAFHSAKVDLSSFCQFLSCDINQLTGDEKSILPPRKYLHHYRGGIKWDPQDDKCKFVAISLSYSETKTAFISGKLFAM